MSFLKNAEIFLRKIKPSNFGWFGNFKSWEAAQKKSTGYDSFEIVSKTKEAILKVINGEAIYERDSVLFDKIEYSWPLLASLLWIANQNKDNLKIIDFGGSLGSTYYQNRKFLSSLNNCEWNIVEQHSFVQAGKEINVDDNLQFFNTVNEAINKNGMPDVLLLGCTLPYIQDPYSLLNELISINVKFIIIDNTYFNYIDSNRICIQKVSSKIYSATYPCWMLNYKKVIETISRKYKIIAEYKNESFLFLDGRKIQYKGFIAKLNEKQD